MIYKSLIMLVLLIMLIAASGLSGDKSTPEVEFQTGTIVKTEPAGPYIYLLVNVEDREFWISTIAKYLPADIAAGDEIEYTGGMHIQGFKSPSMEKSFKSMLLVSKIRVLKFESESD